MRDIVSGTVLRKCSSVKILIFLYGEEQPMKNMRGSLWLLLFSQVLFLMGSLIEPPTTWLMITLRGIVPLLAVVYIGLILAGYIHPRKK